MRALKWSVPVDDRPHKIGTGKVLLVSCQSDPAVVQVWTEEPESPDIVRQDRPVQVFGTGQPIPLPIRHVGSTVTAGGALVWHCYEVRER